MVRECMQQLGLQLCGQYMCSRALSPLLAYKLGGSHAKQCKACVANRRPAGRSMAAAASHKGCSPAQPTPAAPPADGLQSTSGTIPPTCTV